jgi:GMP synthase PP-ATPase subunit
MFTSVLQTGEEMIEHTIRDNGMMLHVSVVTIQPGKIVCGVIQNMQEPEVRKDMIKNSVREVIHQNMAVVQKIAYLLGENASFTESMLNTIMESEGPELVNEDNSVHHG